MAALPFPAGRSYWAIRVEMEDLANGMPATAGLSVEFRELLHRNLYVRLVRIPRLASHIGICDGEANNASIPDGLIYTHAATAGKNGYFASG